MTSTTNLNQSPNIKHNTNPLPKGFTIIEVVLVLAIAGLIFLMVFIALPALQRNQRDTQRKNDISRLQEAIERYKANNKGQLPWEVGVIGDHNTSNFANNYLKRDQGEWRDPSGSPYRVTVNVSKPGNVHTGYSYYMDRPNGDYRILIAVAARCSGETFEWGDHPNSYVLLYSFEGGGRVCADG